MPVLSRVSDKCKKCFHVNDCNNKRMEACALSEIQNEMSVPRPITNPTIAHATISPLNPILIDTSLISRISQQLEKDFYKNIFKCNHLES